MATHHVSFFCEREAASGKGGLHFASLIGQPMVRVLTLLSIAMAPLVASAQAKARAPVVLTDEALKLHRDALVFDGHNDLPWQYRKHRADPLMRQLDIAVPQPSLHTDIPRLRKGNVGAQFWSVYVDASTAKKRTAVTQTLEQLD